MKIGPSVQKRSGGAYDLKRRGNEHDDAGTIVTASETITELGTYVSSASMSDDSDHDSEEGQDDNHTSRADNTKSQMCRSRSSMFEINCSPLQSTAAKPRSYFEQTRRREQHRQHEPSQPHEDELEGKITPLHTPIHKFVPNTTPIDFVSKKQALQYWGRRSINQNGKRSVDYGDETALSEERMKEVECSNCNEMHGNCTECQAKNPSCTLQHSTGNDDGNGAKIVVDDDDDDDDEDDDGGGGGGDEYSCCTLADSEMYESSNWNLDACADNNTIATGNLVERTNPEHGNTSNITITSVSVATNNSDLANSICSSVSRGEEHITSRLKKYGLFNLHEMKRKQQRRASRNQKINNNCTSDKQGRTGSVVSGLSAGSSMMHSTDPSGLHNSSDHANTDSGIPTRIRTAPLHVQIAVEETHRWLFTEGGHFEDVQSLMTQYSLYVREHFGIPLDRLYYGGIGLHPKLTAYMWKWEPYGEFTHSEMPPEVFARRNEIFSPDEPFCVMEQGRADFVRIRDTDEYIPPDTAKWFRSGKYKDYFALPDIHRGVSKGGLAWSTKCKGGFCDDDIQFFRMTHPALTTIMRLHTNDLVLKTMTDRMESEIKERTTELADANRKLEAANAEISQHASKQLEHFACMSHEIRTPLNCIVGMSSLLLETDNLNEELLDMINMVYNSADLVQGVVNDVLDYAKIESGHFELDIQPIDLQATLNGVVHSISNKLRTQDKNVEVRTHYCGHLGKTMTTDGRRLQQVLYNILGNAAKFSREGTTIDLKVSILAASGGDNDKPDDPNDPELLSRAPHKIQFSIKDYGKGIDAKDFEKIFQPFSQASKETQTIYGGTGLGLSITKKIVSRLGGTISIKSEVGKYTEFIVDLPYEDGLKEISRYQEMMTDTSIVILDPTERPTIAVSLEEDEFAPFPPTLIKQYGLTVLRCSSWGELESKLGLKANVKEKYVFLAHEDIEERQSFINIEKLVGRDRCSWLTFGSETSLIQQRHIKTLTRVFPATLIDKLVQVIASQRGDGDSFNDSNNSCAQSSGDSASESHGAEDDQDETSFGSKKSSSTGDPAILRHVCKIDDAIEPTSPPPTKSRKKFVTRYPSRALKMLIVDDNVINQKVLDRILKRLGVTDIHIVDNGKKAVDITETTSFDCILMDVEMPVMGGLEACRRIVARDKEAARVIFVTGHDIEDIKEKADAAGAFDYISKPLRMTEINSILTTLEDLNNRIPSSEPTKMKPNEEHPRKRSTPPKKKRCAKQYPAREIKVLVAEDNVINQKVLDRILKRVGVTDITIVDNGKKAVDISETTKFDCILMDMQMPIMGGLEACKIIVERDKGKKDPPKVIFVTAHALVEFKEKAIAAGGDDFITKPFKMQDIDNVMKTVEDAKRDTSIAERER
eukprot:CAMPEP_0172393354 /NCGR_PEP_ID=MMETSP1061-20121228/9230_1 /TAXON_ID=37318 /ORGANISM="Pseudo-nitzschia pungens, Strain cf. pungens" /LENGTH=1391 /DNA_ID=CAMNT_0013124391 /DNA_START=71 /DNA_END=4246 /DNA_ORIENTATION=-